MAGYIIESSRADAKLDAKHKDTYAHLAARGVSPVMRRHAAQCLENMSKVYQEARRNPLVFQTQFPIHAMLEGYRPEPGEGVLTEDTLTANIPSWTQTAVDMVEQLYEGWFLDNVFDMGTMTQPTAFVNREFFKAGTAVAGEYFNDPDLLSLDGDLDVDYLDLNEECGSPREIDYSITQELITAKRKAVAGDVGSIAQHDGQTQFGVDILNKVQSMGALELQREIQGEAVAAAVAGVSDTVTWTADPAAGSVYESLDPDVWARTLASEAMVDVDTLMMGEKGIRAGWNRAIAQPASLARLLKLNKPAFDLAANMTDTTGSLVNYHNLFGVAKAQDKMLFQYEYVADDTILCVRKDARFKVFGHLTYVPIESFGVFIEPRNGCARFGMHTRYVNKIIRSGGLKKIAITPEAS